MEFEEFRYAVVALAATYFAAPVEQVRLMVQLLHSYTLLLTLVLLNAHDRQAPKFGCFSSENSTRAQSECRSFDRISWPVFRIWG